MRILSESICVNRIKLNILVKEPIDENIEDILVGLGSYSKNHFVLALARELESKKTDEESNIIIKKNSYNGISGTHENSIYELGEFSFFESSIFPMNFVDSIKTAKLNSETPVFLTKNRKIICIASMKE